MSKKNITEIHAAEVNFGHGVSVQQMHYIAMALHVLTQSQAGNEAMRKDAAEWASVVEKAIQRAMTRYVEDHLERHGERKFEIFAGHADNMDALRTELENEIRMDKKPKERKRPDDSKPSQDN